MIFFLLTLMSSVANAQPPVALIYNGPGTCNGCPEAIGDRMKAMGFSVSYVGGMATDPAGRSSRVAISKALLDQAAIYVQPGGDDVLAKTLDAIKDGEKQAIRDYVKSGGRYLGVCAGAYIAGKMTFDEGKAIPGLGLIACFVDDEGRKAGQKRVDPKARAESIKWHHHGAREGATEVRSVYFQDGPRFCTLSVPDGTREQLPHHLPDEKVYATYLKTGDVAAISVPYGSGLVGLIGPHPEADYEWFEEDHIESQAPSKYSGDLIDEMVRDLVPAGAAQAPRAPARIRSGS